MLKFVTFLFLPEISHFLLAIRDLDDSYRAIAKRKFDMSIKENDGQISPHYFTRTINILREENLSKDAEYLQQQ